MGSTAQDDASAWKKFPRVHPSFLQPRLLDSVGLGLDTVGAERRVCFPAWKRYLGQADLIKQSQKKVPGNCAKGLEQDLRHGERFA